ncbi:hypothetical protein [Desulfogranum japonicum]|uniref:hypothetical protein n=1 Tax=Desulfogranum japonicum TaxID=231447 RepID=UPI001969F0BA|nr:hypothetical protein [Desulfogranum japonicum]
MHHIPIGIITIGSNNLVGAIELDSFHQVAVGVILVLSSLLVNGLIRFTDNGG